MKLCEVVPSHERHTDIKDIQIDRQDRQNRKDRIERQINNNRQTERQTNKKHVRCIITISDRGLLINIFVGGVSVTAATGAATLYQDICLEKKKREM